LDERKSDVSHQEHVLDIKRLVAENRIRGLLTDYCHGVDRKDWDVVRACYHDDAYDSHGAFGGSADELVAWMKTTHQHVSSSMHVLTNIKITIADNFRTARTESYCLSYKQTDSAEDDAFLSGTGLAGPVRRTVACRFIDDFELRSSVGWRIVRRIVVIEWTRRDESHLFMQPNPEWVAPRRDHKDPFYLS
jgi:hypothetical protein